jgi:hypothetical protein
MKVFAILLVVCLSACNGRGREANENKAGDSLPHKVDSTDAAETPVSAGSDAVKTYSNARFRDVTVQEIDSGRFVIQGQAQIFEANFGWVVEDGHQELKKGFEMTTAGAPEWGDFMFPIAVEKRRPNSTLTLVLFDSSAKDGSRQHELAIPLP